ncbi:MAG: hydrogenase maturation protease [Propionibacteriaceae bacterium]|jgi:hydrogenase maturation protease|nr:hydrogenase maturation protease [Propionibacteriaceae bacterium]
MSVTVLGVGNPIMGDDAVGLEVLKALRETRGDDGVEYVDGGTAGMELIPVVQDASRLLVLDAVVGDVPGAVVRLSGDQLPRLLSAKKLSPHQVGLLDVLTSARLLGGEPEMVEVVGVAPESVELRVGMSQCVAAAIDEAVAAASAVLDDWLA